MASHASGELIQLYLNVALQVMLLYAPLEPSPCILPLLLPSAHVVIVTHLEYKTTVSLLIVMI